MASVGKGGFKLNWKGNIVVKLTEEALRNIVADIGMTSESQSKLELYPGHGVLSGDLRNSVHVARPGHVFAGEGGTGDLGGQRVIPEQRGKGQWALSLGSGMVYAMAIHQGWPVGHPGLRGSFAGYHYLTKGIDKTRPQIPTIILKNRVR